MEILRNVFLFLLILSFVLIFLFVFYFFSITFYHIFKRRILFRRLIFKNKLKRIYVLVKKIKYINYVEFIKWVLIDILRGKEKLKLFGIWCFTGYFGEGKTLGAVTFAKSMQKKYPYKNISIYTNFNFIGQQGKIKKWQDLINLPKNSIVIFDEIQSTFTSQKFKEFPIELLWKLTQCRKQGLMVLCSSPVFHRMTIQLRENSDYVVVCKNFLGLDRWFNYSFYRAPDYERYESNIIRLFASKVMTVSFVPQDKDYKLYNTLEQVDRFDIIGSTHNETTQLFEKKVKQVSATSAALTK